MLEAKIEDGPESEVVKFYIESSRKYLFVAYKNGLIYVYEIHGLMRSGRDFKLVTVYEIKNEVKMNHLGHMPPDAFETTSLVRGRLRRSAQHHRYQVVGNHQ